MTYVIRGTATAEDLKNVDSIHISSSLDAATGCCTDLVITRSGGGDWHIQGSWKHADDPQHHAVDRLTDLRGAINEVNVCIHCVKCKCKAEVKELVPEGCQLEFNFNG